MGITRFNAGDGYAHYVGKDGVSLEILPQAAGGSGGTHPYKVTVYKDGASWKAKVYPGSINGQTSTLGGQPLDATPPPTTTISASGYLYLEVTHTDGSAFPVSSTVQFDTTVPTPNTNTKAYIGLAYVEYTGTSAKKMSQLVTTSLWGERLKCGSSTAEYFFSAS